MMTLPAYALARAAAPKVAEHLRLHRSSALASDLPPIELLPDAAAVEAMVDTAFWASVRREEGYIPKISLAYLPPLPEVAPLIFAQPMPLDPTALTRLAAAVERPGIHLGVWNGGNGLEVWGTSHTIPPFCFVVEVVAAGLLVLKHRPRHESRKFVNVAVFEGDRVKVIDERASLIPDCPAVLTPMIGFDTRAEDGVLNVLVQLALSMRRHQRGGILLVVRSGSDGWRESIVHPLPYAVKPAYSGLADLVQQERGRHAGHEWLEDLNRAVESVAGLTAVDGATVITDKYEVLAFGAKIRRRDNQPWVADIVVTEPIEGAVPHRLHPGQLGGTRHLSAAQFALDQPDSVVLVASQDGRFTLFAWSPCEGVVHAHRVEALLL